MLHAQLLQYHVHLIRRRVLHIQQHRVRSLDRHRHVCRCFQDHHGHQLLHSLRLQRHRVHIPRGRFLQILLRGLLLLQPTQRFHDVLHIRRSRDCLHGDQHHQQQHPRVRDLLLLHACTHHQRHQHHRSDYPVQYRVLRLRGVLKHEHVQCRVPRTIHRGWRSVLRVAIQTQRVRVWRVLRTGRVIQPRVDVYGVEVDGT